MFERSEKAIFMIESGRALDLIKHHITEKKRVSAEVRALAKELGVESIYTSQSSGVLTAVEFPGKAHPDFKKPTKRGSYPKKGSAWATRLAEQNGYDSPSNVIADAFQIPLSISYHGKGDAYGSSCIGFPLNECGFLYLSADGPYAMWTPDVLAEVAAYEADGWTVKDPAKSFRLEFDGCRRIEREEWEILVAQHKLEQKRAEKAAA